MNEYNKDKKPEYCKPSVVFRKEVLYDINSLPFYDNDNNFKIFMDVVTDLYNKSGILIYDSSKGIVPIFTEKELKR